MVGIDDGLGRIQDLLGQLGQPVRPHAGMVKWFAFLLLVGHRAFSRLIWEAIQPRTVASGNLV
jgi:hypothetical protein